MAARWRYPRTMPRGTPCWVRSVTGIECTATLSRYGARKIYTINGVDRVHCWRRDTKSGSGDLWVIAWKPLTAANGGHDGNVHQEDGSGGCSTGR